MSLIEVLLHLRMVELTILAGSYWVLLGTPLVPRRNRWLAVLVVLIVINAMAVCAIGLKGGLGV
jgi:hypothetical protein